MAASRGRCTWFFTHLTQSLEAYAPHQYELKLSNRVFKPETHKCEVHHLTFDPKVMTVDEIEWNHPRSAKLLHQRKIERVLRSENVVVHYFSKAKASAAYNQ